MADAQIETFFDAPMSVVFAALIAELARGRWAAGDSASGSGLLPRPGLRFSYRQGRRLVTGRVLECLRPVSLVIVENSRGAAGSVVIRQRWRVDHRDSTSRLDTELKFDAHRLARLQLGSCESHYIAAARGVCARLQTRLRKSDRSAACLPGGAERIAALHASGRGDRKDQRQRDHR
jgi:hypothetical protein